MIPRAIIVSFVATLATATATATATVTPTPTPIQSYSESLSLSPLPDGKLLSQFTFNLSASTNTTTTTNSLIHNHSLLPPVLLSLLAIYNLSSFHFTLSSGRWSPIWLTSAETAQSPAGAASGIEVVGWLQRSLFETDAEEEKRWIDFTSALGGLFCAGIIGNTRGRAESRPEWAYKFDGIDGNRDEHSLYRTLLPRLSATCTESLTPFISLLPCGAHAGLASLLNPHTLFDGDWTLIGVHVVKLEDGVVKVELQVGSVADPVRKSRLNGALGRREFSMQSLYDRTLSKTCPVATSSKVKLLIPVSSTTSFKINPTEGENTETSEGVEWAVWDTTTASSKRLKQNPLDVHISWPNENTFRPPHPSKLQILPLTTRRILMGQGQERGTIGIEIENHQNSTVEVVWVESWPWWVRGFVHTLDLSSSSPSTSFSIPSAILNLAYEPPIPRQRPTTLQVLVRIKPLDKIRLLLDYESSYLWYTEYPPDAHRGFEIPGGLVVLLGDEEGESLDNNSSFEDSPEVRIINRQHLFKIHTPSTLLSLPTPDFSMPYNVIILTSTVIALFFGSVMNALVRGWAVISLEEDGEDKDDVEKKVEEVEGEMEKKEEKK